jgi:hypothetical protein
MNRLANILIGLIFIVIYPFAVTYIFIEDLFKKY